MFLHKNVMFLILVRKTYCGLKSGCHLLAIIQDSRFSFWFELMQDYKKGGGGGGGGFGVGKNISLFKNSCVVLPFCCFLFIYIFIQCLVNVFLVWGLQHPYLHLICFTHCRASHPPCYFYSPPYSLVFNSSGCVSSSAWEWRMWCRGWGEGH